MHIVIVLAKTVTIFPQGLSIALQYLERSILDGFSVEKNTYKRFYWDIETIRIWIGYQTIV